MKLLEDPTMVMVLKTEGGELTPGKAETLLRDTISKLIRTQGDDHAQIKECPQLPHWFSDRPGLSDDFVALNRAFSVESSSSSLASSQPEAPLELQEQALIDDYLYAMMGIEGHYLNVEAEEGSGKVKWAVSRKKEAPLHDALVGLVERMLPLCECYVEVNKFVDDFAQFECGMVAHALSASISSLLRDYLILVAQLEQQHRSGRLSLQKIWFYIQTSLDSMLLLRDVTREARYYHDSSVISPSPVPSALVVASTSSKPPSSSSTPTPQPTTKKYGRKKFGAELLNLLYDRWIRTVSDKSANELFLFLLQKSSVPYWEMLKSWIYKGVLKDPYGEFLVEENRTVLGSSETYWDKKYTLRPGQVPVFLQPFKEHILTTGKYINAIRECGMHFNTGDLGSDSTGSPSASNFTSNTRKQSKNQAVGSSTHAPITPQVIEEFAFTANERVYAEKIDRAYQYASGRLLQVLRTDFGLLSKLRSVKHYFLLDQGDFFIHFMDAAEDELKPPAANVQESTLQTLVDIAIRASVVKDDELGESMRVKLLPYNLVNQLIARHKKDPVSSSVVGYDPNASIAGNLKDLSALEALTLDWQVGWPLVLIFNRNTIDMYQILFRHLFYCKHVERILGRAWTQHQLTKQLFQRRRPPQPSSSGPSLAKGTSMTRSKSTAASNPTSSTNTTATTSIPVQISDAGSDYNLLTRCFALRQRMLHFIQNLQYYMVMEVIEPRYYKLEDTLRNASTVDELLDAHNSFLNECHRNCLLTEMDLFKIITKLLSVCVIFCNYTERFIKQLTLEQTASELGLSSASSGSSKDSKSKTSASAAAANRAAQRRNVTSMEGRKMLAEKGFGATMGRFEANFDKYYRMLMEATTTFQNPHFPEHGLLSLNIRLDFNDFYSNRFQ